MAFNYNVKLFLSEITICWKPSTAGVPQGSGSYWHGRSATPSALWIFSSDRGKTLCRSAGRPAGRFLETAGTGGNPMGSHGGGGHQFVHVLAGALRTNGRGIRRRQNQLFKTVTTAFTLIFIDRHCFFLLQRNVFIDGFAPLVKINPSPMPAGNFNFGLFIILTFIFNWL